MENLTLLQMLLHMKLMSREDRRKALTPKECQDLGFLFSAYDSFHPETPFETLRLNGWSNWDTQKVKEFHKKLYPELYSKE